MYVVLFVVYYKIFFSFSLQPSPSTYSNPPQESESVAACTLKRITAEDVKAIKKDELKKLIAQVVLGGE